MLTNQDMRDIHEDMVQLLQTPRTGKPPTFYELRLLTSVATMARRLDEVITLRNMILNDLQQLKTRTAGLHATIHTNPA